MKRLSLFQRPYFAHRILEVGGGHNPYAGVTHAVDKFPNDDTQRAAGIRLDPSVEFREGDLEAIPFPSEPQFDFIYVSHVIEHVARPEAAISEINRVASRGYLETPSPLREQLACPMPFDSIKDFHSLFCWMEPENSNVHVIHKNSDRIGEFCDCSNGKLAEKLFNAVRKQGIDVEPLLPRNAKTSHMVFSRTIQLIPHHNFRSACRDGHCAYQSTQEALLWAAAPRRWIGERFSRLNQILSRDF